ncbi:MAG: DUF4126 domain-containing protein, partial [Candidatus Omnitrophota bacterium]
MEVAILPLAGWASGISIYLTIAIMGISARMGWIDLPAGLDVLSHPLVIALAILVYVVEFVADKVPFVDSAWDAVHTFIRPTGALAIGFMAGTEHGLLAQTALAIVTGSIALDSHAVKSATRLAVNTSPEPFSNIATSLAEHSFVFFLFWLFIKHPIICLVVLALLVLLSFFVLRALWRFVLK